MSSFVLVHGSWHGPWCWYRVLPRLRDAGHGAVAPELPAHGVDERTARDVSFADYVDEVATTVEQAAEDVVLVGHSMGGHVVTQVAERCADEVAAVVYLAAFRPRDGQALTDLDVSAYESVVQKYAVPDEERGVVAFDPDGAEEAFYHDCDREAVTLGRSLLRPEPIEPRTVPVDLSDQRYGGVSTAYVETTADRALPIGFQRSLQDAAAVDAVRTLDTGHSPFFAAPERLTDVLLELRDTLP